MLVFHLRPQELGGHSPPLPPQPHSVSSRDLRALSLIPSSIQNLVPEHFLLEKTEFYLYMVQIFETSVNKFHNELALEGVLRRQSNGGPERASTW